MSEEAEQRIHQLAPSSSDSVINTPSSEHGMSPVFARAKHTFKGRNNDELAFRKGDVITVTQQLEGGWWEGTLHANTGWFPSNYVTVIPESERFLRSRSNGPPEPNGHNNLSIEKNVPLFSSDSSRRAYRQQVINSFLEAEQLYVDGITEFYNNMLSKVQASKMISKEDFVILSGNLPLLVAQQREILDNIREAVEKDSTNARIGGLLLHSAPILRQLLSHYCENHPKAVDLVLRNKNEYEKILSHFKFQLKDLISGLSCPFRHLETYSSILTELERGMHEAHRDRGDTRRSAAVFREIANDCTNVRKQKEMHLELTSSGLINGLTKEEIVQLGEISYMGLVAVENAKIQNENELSCDRCIVLYQSVMLVLEVTSNVNCYVLKNKLLLEGLTVKKSESEPAIHLCIEDGSSVIVMRLRSNEELQNWLKSLSLCNGLVMHESCTAAQTTATPSQQIYQTSLHNVAEISPLRRAKISDLPSAVRADNAKRNAMPAGLRFDHELEMVLPEGIDEGGSAKSGVPKQTKLYSGYCLRPYPAVRGNYAVDYSTKPNVKLRREALEGDQEDALLLRIVEGYCVSIVPGKHLQAGRSNQYQTPQLIVADDEKMFMEEMVGDELVVKEKSLVDTVYALKDQLNVIQKECQQLTKTIDREQKARRRLEEMVRRISRQLTHPASKPSFDSLSVESSILQ